MQRHSTAEKFPGLVITVVAARSIAWRNTPDGRSRRLRHEVSLESQTREPSTGPTRASEGDIGSVCSSALYSRTILTSHPFGETITHR